MNNNNNELINQIINIMCGHTTTGDTCDTCQTLTDTHTLPLNDVDPQHYINIAVHVAEAVKTGEACRTLMSVKDAAQAETMGDIIYYTAAACTLLGDNPVKVLTKTVELSGHSTRRLCYS